MKINLTETVKTEKEINIEFPCYRVHIMKHGGTFAFYKITGTDESPMTQQLMVCYEDAFVLSKTCVENAFSEGTEEATEQEWAESLVKLSVQIQKQLKEYSI